MLSFIMLCVLLVGIELKLLGAYNISPVERKGYCVLNYGEKYYYNNLTNSCSRYDNPSYDFLEIDFRNYCIKPNLLSSQIFSDCFYAGGNN